MKRLRLFPIAVLPIVALSIGFSIVQGQGRGAPLPPPGTLQEVVLSISKTRPLLEAADLLQRRSGVAMSYEDGAWVYAADGNAGDLARIPGFPDLSHPEVRVPDILSMPTSRLEIRLTIDARSKLIVQPAEQVAGNALIAAIADHAARANPGIFTYLYLGENGFSVMPLQIRDKDGQPTETHSPLDYPITFPAQERPTLETLVLIAKLTSDASGRKVDFNAATKELAANQTVVSGANGEAARTVLARTLREIKRGNPSSHAPVPKRSWRLLYDFKTGAYSMDVSTVRQDIFNANGNAAGQSAPVPWPEGNPPQK